MPTTPAVVKADTTGWRAEADLVCAYVLDRLRFDPGAHIITSEMYADFTSWIMARGHKAWADQTLSARFAGHGMVEAGTVEKRRITNGPGLSRSGVTFEAAADRYMAWTGVRFRRESDDDEQTADQQNQAQWQGWQGYSDDSHTSTHIETTRPPLPPLPADHSDRPALEVQEPALRADRDVHRGDDHVCPDCGRPIPRQLVRCDDCTPAYMAQLREQVG